MPGGLVLATCGLAEKWLPVTDVVNGHYPLGLAILHAVVERTGRAVETHFLVAETTAASVAIIDAALRRSGAAFLGLSVITDNRVSSFRVIEAVRRDHPEVRIILGGIHATTMHAQILEKYPFVTIVLGEGEATLPELMVALDSGQDLALVPGIAFWRDGKVVRTEDRALIEDLDSLPMPRHDLFYSPKRQIGQLLTSRGCPYACSFCCLDSTSRRRVRKRSVDAVVDEIEMILKTQPQTSQITIYDDQFFADNKRVIAICDEIVRRGIRCRFYCQGRVRPLSRALVLALERAGFIHVTLGLESGSADILERCHKKIRLDDVARALELFADSTIDIAVLLIIGLPGETMASIDETISSCRRFQKVRYHPYSNRIQDLFVYPGTEIGAIYRQAGRISDDYWLGDGDCPRFDLELNDRDFALFRDALLDSLSPFRLFTKEGFARQKAMIPPILAAAYSERPGDLALFVPLARAAFSMAVHQGTITLLADSAIPRTALVASRRPGSDDSLRIGYAALPNGLDIDSLLEFAFRWKTMPDLAAMIARAVQSFIEEGLALEDGRLAPFRDEIAAKGLA